MSIYFNHSLLEHASDDVVNDYLKEIIKLKSIVKNNNEQLCFYQDLWNVNIASSNLRDYLIHLDNREPAKVMIDTVMGGPYFYYCEDNKWVKIYPKVSSGFCSVLLKSCFNDNVDRVLSLEDEDMLTEEQYEIDDSRENFDVHNIKGKESLIKCLDDDNVFKNIKGVFEAVENKSKRIIILDDAKKSAKKHDFRGKYKDVYNAMVSLERIELPALIKGMNDELRKKQFLELCQMEVSRESNETLSIERYRQEREFVVPELGKVVFEWHIKVDGNNTRIHYFIDKTSKKIYIGHCGKHLGTVGFNS